MFFRRSPSSGGGCPGSRMQSWDEDNKNQSDSATDSVSESVKIESRLRQWPVQLTLVPPNAPYFQDADLAIVADCVPFAYGNFHDDFLKDRPIVIGCPKLDDLQSYVEKLTDIFKLNKMKSVEVLLMEVPCCGGIAQAARAARDQAGADFPITITTIGVRGEKFDSQSI